MSQSYKRPAPPSRPGSPPVRFDAGSPLAGPHVQPCPDCGSTARVRGPGKGKHFASERCGGCGRFVSWLPTPPSIERALGFRIYFGKKHRGRTMGQVAKIDPNYLAWVAENFNATPDARKVADLAALALAVATAEGGRP